MTRQTGGGQDVSRNVRQQHVRAGLQLFLREPFWKQNKGDEESSVGLPIDEMKRELVCDVRREVGAQGCRENVVGFLRRHASLQNIGT